MHIMHVNELDLNLLRVFDAMMRSLNVTQAAQRLGLTQPAASHALQRLRQALGDPLFVRTSGGMQPTPFALGIGERVGQAMSLLEACLEQDPEFSPHTTTRTFTLFITDIGDIVLLPALMAHFKTHAPRARLRAVGASFKDVGRELESGGVDIAVTVLPVLGAGFYQQALFREQYVCIARADHPQIKGRLSLQQFARAAHALVTTEGTGHEVIEHNLIKRKLGPNIMLRTPHFLAMPSLISQSDMIATVPRRLALATLASHNIQMLPNPIRLPAYGVKQFWHKRLHDDPAHRWFRRLMVALFKDS
jgi:DNA-binding transcriptional LysR family regulator